MAALRLQGFDMRGLGARVSLGPPIRNASSNRRRGHRARTIAGEQFNRKAKALQRRHGFRRIFPQPIGEAEDHRRAIGSAIDQHHAIRDARHTAKGWRAEPRKARLQTLPGDFHRIGRKRRIWAGTQQRLGQGVARCARHAGGGAQHFRRLAFGNEYRAAFRQRAGLVQHGAIRAGQTFQRRCGGHQYTATKQRSAGHHLHCRHSNRQAARAGNQQHADRIHQRFLPHHAKAQPPQQESDRRNGMGDGHVKPRGAIRDGNKVPLGLFSGFQKPRHGGE